MSTTASPDIMQQLVVLQAKVAAFEFGQNGFSVCGGGRGGGMTCVSVTVVVVGLLKALWVVFSSKRKNKPNNKATSSDIKSY